MESLLQWLIHVTVEHIVCLNNIYFVLLNYLNNLKILKTILKKQKCIKRRKENRGKLLRQSIDFIINSQWFSSLMFHYLIYFMIFIHFSSIVQNIAHENILDDLFFFNFAKFGPFSDRLTRNRHATFCNGCAGPIVFQKNPNQFLSGPEWRTMALIYKSRIVRSTMFSSPHINPGGEKAVHPVLFNGWPLTCQRDPWFLIYQVSLAHDSRSWSISRMEYKIWNSQTINMRKTDTYLRH